MKKIIMLSALIILLASCGRGDKHDLRGVSWGMSKDEVKKTETAELVNESPDVLTYRLGGVTKVEIEDSGDSDTGEGVEETPPEVEAINPEYDLVYVFNNDRLSMIVIHLRDKLASPSDYMELFREHSKIISEQTGVKARGLASYAEGEETAADPYSDPASICSGGRGLQHFWPELDKRTNLTLELDGKKYAPAPECNISMFYESVQYPADPALSEELHDLL